MEIALLVSPSEFFFPIGSYFLSLSLLLFLKYILYSFF